MRPKPRAEAAGHSIDPWLTMALLALACIGLLMVYSSSIADAYSYYGSAYYVAERELIWMGIGFVALAVAARVHYGRWQQIAFPFFAVSLAMLVLVLVPHIGHDSHGARRWFSLTASITIEPSEVIKLALVVYMAAWLSSKGDKVRDFRDCFVPFALILGLVVILIVKQPDLGTSIVIGLSMLAVFFVAGADIAHLLLVCCGAAVVAWGLSHGSGYRQGRLTAFLDPWHDPTGVGYHTVQALLALGSGGLWGEGLGNSTQKWALPAPHTDSILAVIGEEWGLLGSLTVLLLFLIIAYRGTRIAMTAPDPFGRLLAAGITSWITFQALLNFGVITSSVPFTGVPLPLVSYGGTSLILTMTALGILLNVSRYTTGEAFARPHSHNGRRNRRPRLSRSVNHPVPVPARSGGSRVRARKV